MMISPAIGLLLMGASPPSARPGPVSVDVVVRTAKDEDDLVIRLINGSAQPITVDLRDSPCSSTELATLAFVGKGAIGFPVERVGLPLYELPIKKTIEPHGIHTCTYSISNWYDGRWEAADRPKVRIFWSFEPLEEGVYDKVLYGGVVSLVPPPPKGR